MAIDVENTRSTSLTNLLCVYYDDFSRLRAMHDEIGNLEFHRRFGFSIQVPEDWNIIEDLRVLINHAKAGKVLIIYSNSKSYRDIYDKIGQSHTFSYISWHEIHTAMQIAVSDASYIRRVTELFKDAGLIILVDPPNSLPDVVNQIRLNSLGCLISIGTKL